MRKGKTKKLRTTWSIEAQQDVNAMHGPRTALDIILASVIEYKFLTADEFIEKMKDEA